MRNMKKLMLVLFAVVSIFSAAIIFGGCTPPAITVQQETTEKVAFDFLAEEKFYNCEAKTWVLPFGGPKDSLTLEVLQPGKGWKPVTDFGLAAWWKTGEVQVVDIKDRLAAFGCVMWRIMDRNFEYTVEVKK
jgi:hypothetical protein